MLPEGLELDLQHRRLNGIQTGVDADSGLLSYLLTGLLPWMRSERSQLG